MNDPLAKALRRRKRVGKRGENIAARFLSEKGYSIVATKLYFNDKNKVKVEIGLAKGKKLYDKRQTLKEKAIKRDIERFS